MPLPNNILNDVRGSSGHGTHSLPKPLNVFDYQYNEIHVSTFDLKLLGCIVYQDFSTCLTTSIMKFM